MPYSHKQRRIITVATGLDGSVAEFADDEMLQNREFVLIALKTGLTSNLYRILPIDLRNDFEITMIAVTHYPLSLEFASDEMKDNYEIVMMACKNKYQAHKFASGRLRECLDVHLTSKHPNEYDFGDDIPAFFNDRESVLKIVSHDGWALKYVEESFQDYDMVVAAVRSPMGLSLEFVSPRFRKKQELVILALSIRGVNLEFVDEELKTNKTIVTVAVRNDGAALKYAPRWRDNIPIVKIALRTDRNAIFLASDRIQRIYVPGSEDCFRNANDDKHIGFKDVDPALHCDPDVVESLITGYPPNYRDAPEYFRNNYRYCDNDVRLFEFASEELRNDCDYVRDRLDDPEFAHHAFRFAGDIPKNTYDIAKKAIITNPFNYEYLSPEFRDNREFATIALGGRGQILLYASNELKNDREMVRLAMMNNVDALRYANKSFQKDWFFVRLFIQAIFDQALEEGEIDPEELRKQLDADSEFNWRRSKRFRDELDDEMGQCSID